VLVLISIIVSFLSGVSEIRICNYMKYCTVHALNECSRCVAHKIITVLCLWPGRKECIV